MTGTETKVTYTPGPWKLDGVYCIVTGEDEAIATVHGKRAVAGNNANVIAAAPDMLEALEAAHAALVAIRKHILPHVSGQTRDFHEEIDAAAAAIAKAKGGAA